MQAGRLFGVPVRIHPVTLLLAALAIWLGEGKRFLIMTGSIMFHELMHAAAARVLRVRVVELEITPVGGAARLENLWRLRPGQMTAVAMAGPVGSLLLMICAAAVCWWGILPPYWAAAMIEQNLIILLFNLLPALPMDGGRVLCGLLERKISAVCAAKVGTWMAWGLAGGLIALSVYGLRQGKLNITLPAAAVFLMMSAGRERRQAESAWIDGLTGRAAELEEEAVLPVCWLAVRSGTTAREAAVHMKPRHVHRLAVYDEQMRLEGVVDEAALVEALLADGERKMGEMKENVNSKKVEKRC